MAPWKLPLIVFAIAVSIAFAFYAGGPGVGISAGAMSGVAIVFVAVRLRPRTAIGEPPSPLRRRRLLIVVSRAVEDAETIRAIVAEVRGGEAISGEPTEVLVLAPAQIGFLDRWASDVEGARREAQRRLVLTVASLAKAGVSAEARVGDEDLVQAVEDQVQSFPATAVILATGGGEDPAGAAAAAELGERLRAGFRRLALSGPAAG